MNRINTKNLIRILFCVALISSCHSQKQLVKNQAPKTVIPTVATVPAEEPEDNNVKEVYQGLSSIPYAEYGTWAGNIQYAIDSLCRGGIMTTSQLGIYIYDLTDDSTLYAMNENQRLRPASCEKVITAVSALEYLGGDYNFTTDIRTTGKLSKGTLSGDVYVVGTMDPMLSKPDVAQMAASLKAAGIRRITGHLYLDVSMKDDKPLGLGWCWDDNYGPMSVLTVDGKDVFASCWVAALKKAGIQFAGKGCTKQICPETAQSIGNVSHSIDEVLLTMMKESENIYAESMFYQLAAQSGLKGAGRKEAVNYIEELITKMGLSTDKYYFADGSGLSLYDFASPLLLASFLKHAWKNESIREHLYQSLPISGTDGTLANRMNFGPAYGKIHAKTGTVNSVSTLSGYAQSSNDHILVFSIMNQGIERSSIGRNFQDAVCNVLCK